MDFTLTPTPVYCASEVLSVASEQPVDLDFTLPDYCADVEKIFKCTVNPEIYSTNTGGGQLSVDGASVVRVLYTSTDKKCLKCVEQTVPFSAVFNVSFSGEDYITTVKAKTEYINCKAVSPRRLMIHGAVSLNVKGIEKKSEDIFSAENLSSIQTNCKSLSVCEAISLGSEVFSISESITVSDKVPVSTILRSDVKADITDITAIGNRLIVKGEATLSMLYTSEFKPEVPEQLTYVFPFVHNMESKGAEECDVRDVRLSLCSHDIKLKSDIISDNPVILLEAKIALSSCCLQKKEIEYIDDAYSTMCETELDFAQSTVEVGVKPESTVIMCKSVLDMGDANISKVVDIFCDNINIQPSVTDSLVLSGKANFCIIATAENGELVYLERSVDIDFKEQLSEGFNKVKDITSYVKSISFRLSESSELELRAELCVRLCLANLVNIRYVSEISDCGEYVKSDNSALILYYGDKGESIWEIAKHYRTDKQVLCTENNIEEDELNDKMLLLIPTV